MHIICPPPPPPKRLHNLCYSFLLGIIAVPREIENNAYTKLKGGWGGGGQKRCITWRVGSFWVPPGLCIKTRLTLNFWYGINFHPHAMKTHFNNKGFALGLIFSEGFWISEVAYWVTANVAKWNLAKLNITQYWSVVSPLIHCGTVFGQLQGLRIFTALLLRSNHFPHIAVHGESFKLFCSHPSLLQDKS